MKIQTFAFIPFVLMLAISLGCERKPEDLEVWRYAQGGYEKLAGWVGSAEEPLPVRERGVQILIEERQVNQVGQILDGMEDAATRAALADAALKTVETMWDAQDHPQMSAEVKEKGGQIAVGDSKTVIAKDAAYFLQPHASGAAKEKYEAMLAEWISAEQDLRTQLGSTTVGQILPRSGAAGLKSALVWLNDTAKPAAVQRQILEFSKDEKTSAAMAEVLVKRAEKDFPEISNELEVALLENTSTKVVPFLKKAITTEGAPTRIQDGFMDAIVRIQGDKSTSFFSDLVRGQKGLMRWVAAQRLIEIRGKAGILAAANSLPLEYEAYDGEDVANEMEITCNFVSTEMVKLEVKDISDVLKRALKSDRWPVQALGLKCVDVAKVSALKGDVEALKSSKTAVANWGKENSTIGAIATQVAGKL